MDLLIYTEKILKQNITYCEVINEHHFCLLVDTGK